MRFAIVLALLVVASVAWGNSLVAPPAIPGSTESQWEAPRDVYVKWLQSPDFEGAAISCEYCEDIDLYSECAEDFFCEDGEPIVGVEWWGTYYNWTAIPPYAEYFVIRFYEDVPAPPFSHPGNLLYEENCYVYTEDPISESTFHYYQDLVLPFEQQVDNVYWVSIQCVHPRTDFGQYGWQSCLESDYWNDEGTIISPYFGIYEWTPLSQVIGYHVEFSFGLYAQETTPVQATTWTAVKALFR